MKTNYEDIPADQLPQLRKKVFKRNWSIRLWSALSTFVAVTFALSAAKGQFPHREDVVGRVILGALFAAGFVGIFWKAVVDPLVRRAVEREWEQTNKMD